jgi:hypothetical protein
MSEYRFFIEKLPARIEETQIQYFVPYEDKFLAANEFIGQYLKIEFTGKLQCVDCRKEVKKFYAPGLCYVCMQSSALNSPCIINPELCEAHLGKGKVPEWEEKYHNQPHIVYLANSGGAVKVGVTRTDQIPTRWIDQGADEAIILALTPYRQLAGEIEVSLKPHLSDKTNWRVMLKNEKSTDIRLADYKQRYAEVLCQIDEGYGDFIAEDETIYQLNYPAETLDKSVTSLKLDKQPIIEGILTGIKGQYFILDSKNVINMRSHAGYEVNISVN